MPQPRSIFTGKIATHLDKSANPEYRRLSTPEYHESLITTPDGPKPPTSLGGPSTSSCPQPTTWIPNLPLDPSDSTRRPRGTHTVKSPPAVAGIKRPAPPNVDYSPTPLPTRPAEPASEPLHKRRRLHPRSRRSLPHFTFPKNAHFQNDGQPPSPLFFSSRRARPPLPARFSSSEAAARMLSKTRDESGIKTVTLARGTFSGLSPPAPTSVASGRSSERSSIPRTVSPEARERTDPLRLLGSVGIVELLEQDGRPTFIVDIGDATNYAPESAGLHILFANNALRSSSSVWESVFGKPPGNTTDDVTVHAATQFRGWLLSIEGETSGVNPSPVEHAGIVWSCYTLRKRLRVVSGAELSQAAISLPSTRTSNRFSLPLASSRGLTSRNSAEPPSSSEHVGEQQDYFGNAIPTIVQEQSSPPPPALQNHVIRTSADNSDNGENLYQTSPIVGIPSVEHAPSYTNECVLRAHSAGDVDSFHRGLSDSQDERHDMGFFDWTRLTISPSLPRHIQFARSVDWASTPLGPIEYWSNDLRAMCNLIMASPHPAAMYWGDELVAIYNEAYIGLAGQKHPALMGQSYKVAWSEIWDEVKDVFANARMTGQATMKDDDCLFMKRSGFLEETYFSWSIIPMVGEDGTVMGLYNPAFEKTRRKIAERRMLTLREVGERTAIARDVKGFWDQVLLALTENEFDTPLVMLYSVNDESDSDSSSLYSSSLLGTKHCYLEGSLGVPQGHQAAPESIDLKGGQEGFGPVFREVMKTDKPVVISIGSGDLPQAMMEGLEWRGFGDACREVVICPIHPTTGETVLGFLVMGINPRRPYDDDYNLFIQLLSRQLATSLASVVLFEEEIRRGQKAAKLAAEDRFNLSEQLAARTKEAIESETRFTRMAEYSPAGLFIADHAGRITYCNDTWYEISRVPRERDKTDRWIDYVKQEDQSLILEHWKRLVENAAPINVEFRFKTPWEDRNRNKSDTWVLFSAFPEKDESGQLKSVFGSITNISPQKWAEGFQKRKMEEAVELKRQQENFIDITSHEMRNPLSAILQCADEISTLLGDFRSSGSETIDAGIVADSIDAAQTIALCAQHQKRIVDDVLTLSKLDSAMLMVTPVDAQPLQVVQRALKMFEGEVQTAGIQMEFVLTDSFKKLNVDWVKIDPSRVLQVLINLTTNAIKFTTTEDTRTIKVILSASRERPSAGVSPTVSYFPMRAKRTDQTFGPDWGDGEEIFLEFAVQDTGRGLTPEEKKLLFQRFSQASPRTHVQYGGSGLGLFISRELTELQGGEIGVSSEAGKGSTFAFYVKCRRSSEPEDVIESAAMSMTRKLSNAKDKDQVGTHVAPKIKDFATLPKHNSVVEKANPKKVDSKKVGLKVLIVEDNLGTSINQKVLQRQLQNHGITTHVANHGGEALDVLKASTYWRDAPADATEIGIVLMDKEMPVMDGLQCTSKIRELEQAGALKGHVPIIAVTANARSEQIATLLAAGMDDVVSKPFRIGELIPKIEELASKYSSTPNGDSMMLAVSRGPAQQPYGV
ncbi:Nn.00g072680.m01.CDS01 [Neocucurbitaria sp. VM-36]